ncbi:SusC/RagA family TonB-linked outer membrane protein [Sunxiuqinia elliptica]|uniref:TonB-linked SusC/RagA family outer membrane protein n=1 Tax=Sunxiuqinia elliptica TaxID=655355 RepID=A0A4R6GUA4_9BACT|nr:SusC/RagA family TonB-linked outer membrane protein [Sunxiuqinia elliptica]TDN98410.1 TonB-linked SusC/RagA family outer membrane protein [Sunxiuqinia elliptica]TDO60513.1 TonB-linked SusC/RagA family outer membrane protein [Sunxiuqinia elliptica]
MKHCFKNGFIENFSIIQTFLLLTLFLVFSAFANAEEIKGKVLDTNNEPLIGVTIIIKNTATGTVTDVDGSFVINAPQGSSLVFSYIGFKKQEIVVESQNFITVTLDEDNELMEEVVVVGYGTMKKKDLTGALGTVDAEKLSKEQPATMQDLLRTNVPGLSMGIATDAKGNAGNILIRGKNNLRGKTTPLFVLDGVIYEGELTDINPLDVERVDVLKDASSAAVYGAKAANGVILITTKKGKAGKPVIRFSSILTTSFANSLPEVYQGDDYIAYRQSVMEAQNTGKPEGYYANPANLSNRDLVDWMALSNSTGDPSSVWFTRLGFADIERENYFSGNILNWQDLTYQTAVSQDYSISVSGKNDNMSYYTSINYLDNETNKVGSGYSAVRARLNLEAKATDFLSFGMNSQFITRDEAYISVGGYQALSPFGSLYEEDGTTYKYYPNENLNGYNPFINREYIDRTREYNILNSAFYLKLSLPLGFSIQSTYSPRYQWYSYLNHKSTTHPLWADATDTATRSSSKRLFWQLDNMLKWNKEFGKHAFDFTFLANWEKLQTWSETIVNSGFQPSDVLGAHGISWGTNPEVSSSDSYSTGDALLGRLHYNYDNRYMLTLTARRDGYSAFGQANPRATFPSVAAGWVFTEESFFPESDVFNYGKLRLSWGQNGNRDIGVYQALMQLDSRKYLYIDPNSGEPLSINAYYASRMANSHLQWENTESLNLGLDYGFVDNRISGSIDVYQKKTNDLLIRRDLPDIIGYTSVWSNIGEVQNTGFELAVNTVNIKNKNFSWNTFLGFSYNKNRINSLHGLMEDVLDDEGKVIGQKEADDIGNGWFIGKSIDEIWDYKILGVWQLGEEEEAAKYGQFPGDFKFLDKDGDYKFNNYDKEFQGSKVPTVRINMRNSFTIFNDFTFSFNMYSYLGQKKTFNRAKNNGALINTTNQIITEYWSENNPTNDYARLSSKTPGGIAYSVWRKADFIRLDNVSLGYLVPERFTKRLNINSLNINLSAKNVAYLSNWPGEDPENSGNNTPVSLVFGLNLTL